MTDLISSNLTYSPRSLTQAGNCQFGLAQTNHGDSLVILANQLPSGFTGKCSEFGGQHLCLCPLTAGNASALRDQLPWLKPQPLGLITSAGMGDRIGLATPGHVRAARSVQGRIAPIFAQQSIREMTRTRRSPQQVMDDATWGIFKEGWHNSHGADADHLKSTADIDTCLASGYTFFTIDPGDHVDNRAEAASLNELRLMSEELPEAVNVAASRLLGKTFTIENLSITFDEYQLLKAAVKYGRAIVHVAAMYQHLLGASGTRRFDFEVSVDETEQPTSHAEHVYIASELKRLGVQWISLAPRYVGRFEKGVDYIGDLTAFEASFAGHAAIARWFGPYKLSLHSGSDKFSIYPIAAHLSRGLVHLKTAGTSYLEALRTIAAVDTAFFISIYTFAREHFERDSRTYHVSAKLDRAPLPEDVSDLPALLNQFDAREILHVTFGSVLTELSLTGATLFFDHLMELLRLHSEAYAVNLERHFIRHLSSFISPEVQHEI